MRCSQTVAEKRFWNVVRHRKFHGYKFIRQWTIFSFIVDFYCEELKLVIEIDGEIHADTQEYDEERTQILKSLGVILIRYTNDQVLKELPRVLKHLEKVIRLIISCS